MTAQTIAFVVIGFAAFITACHTLYTRVVKPLTRGVLTIHKTYEKVMEYDDRLKAVESQTTQLVNNGGSSLKDAVDRIEAVQAQDGMTLREHLIWSQNEVAEIWKQIATRDVLNSAHTVANEIEKGEQ